MAQLLRSASSHWLRHAYAKTLVVKHEMPLPVAQDLLGQASAQTTATYAKTDLSQLREFVEERFAKRIIRGHMNEAVKRACPQLVWVMRSSQNACCGRFG